MASIKKRSSRDKWITFRRNYLKGKQNWEGYYECDNCRSWVVFIDVHHIIKRSVRPDLVYDIQNLRLLCRACHTHHHQNLGA